MNIKSFRKRKTHKEVFKYEKLKILIDNKLFSKWNKLNTLNKKIKLLEEENKNEKLKVFHKNLTIYSFIILFCKKLKKKANKNKIKNNILNIQNNVKSFKNLKSYILDQKCSILDRKKSTKLISIKTKSIIKPYKKQTDLNRINSPILNKLKFKYNIRKKFNLQIQNCIKEKKTDKKFIKNSDILYAKNKIATELKSIRESNSKKSWKSKNYICKRYRNFKSIDRSNVKHFKFKSVRLNKDI